MYRLEQYTKYYLPSKIVQLSSVHFQVHLNLTWYPLQRPGAQVHLGPSRGTSFCESDNRYLGQLSLVDLFVSKKSQLNQEDRRGESKAKHVIVLRHTMYFCQLKFWHISRHVQKQTAMMGQFQELPHWSANLLLINGKSPAQLDDLPISFEHLIPAIEISMLRVHPSFYTKPMSYCIIN